MPANINNKSVSEVTINGQVVKEITVNGNIVFQYNKPDSGISFYKFENNGNDSWSNNNFSGGSYSTTNKYGSYSIDLGESSAYIPIGGGLYNGNWSVSTWIRKDDNNSNESWIDFDSRTWSLAYEDRNNNGWEINSGTDSSTINSTIGELPINEWINFVLTYSSDKLRLYVNSDFRTSINTNISSTHSNTKIGDGDFGFSSRVSNGYMDNLKFFDKELSSTEINNLYTKNEI